MNSPKHFINYTPFVYIKRQKCTILPDVFIGEVNENDIDVDEIEDISEENEDDYEDDNEEIYNEQNEDDTYTEDEDLGK